MNPQGSDDTVIAQNERNLSNGARPIGDALERLATVNCQWRSVARRSKAGVSSQVVVVPTGARNSEIQDLRKILTDQVLLQCLNS